MHDISPRLHFVSTVAALLLAMSCDVAPPTAQRQTSSPSPTGRYDPEWKGSENRKRPRIKQVDASLEPAVVTAQPTPPVRPSPGDPRGGHWPLSDALRGLPATGRLMARIETNRGDLTCELWPDRAPLTVANFVGLARGLRPWKGPDGRWQRRRAYDDTTFHRVIPGFAIQGGSPTGRIDFRPGYVIPDEIWEGANHDRAGLLCMVTPQPHTGGMQFFITDGPAPQLDGSHPIFGTCGPLALVGAIARAPSRTGRPLAPIRIESIRITRVSPAAAPSSTTRARPAGSTR